jgi:hypothetical protein
MAKVRDRKDRKVADRLYARWRDHRASVEGRDRKDRKVVDRLYARVLEASDLSLSSVDRLSPDLVDAVARLLWVERWAIKGSKPTDRGLWRKQADEVKDPWRAVARRALSLLFGLKVSSKTSTAKSLWMTKLGVP